MHSFELWLRREGYEDVLLFPELDLWVATHRKLFTWALSIGQIGDKVTILDTWCYPDHAAALAALERWDPHAGGEPEGWHRHPRSGRRRTAARDYVEP